jgi:predicted nucleic acid-binding protein
VLKWLEHHEVDSFLSVITVGELQRGLYRSRTRASETDDLKNINLLPCKSSKFRFHSGSLLNVVEQTA